MTDQERTKTFFSARADGYYERNYENPQNRHARNLALRRTVALDLIPATGVVLDLGCGPGAITIPLLERGRTVISVDLSGEMTASTRAEARRRGLEATVAVANAVTLPFADQTFDVVVTTGVLEYVPDLAAAVREIGRVLVAGGVVVATMSLPRRTERFVMKRVARARRFPPQATQYIRDATSFDGVLKTNGLRIESSRCCGFAPFPLDAILPRSVSWIDEHFEQRLNASSFARRHAKTYVVRAIKP